jgi:hypothetical protein
MDPGRLPYPSHSHILRDRDRRAGHWPQTSSVTCRGSSSLRPVTGALIIRIRVIILDSKHAGGRRRRAIRVIRRGPGARGASSDGPAAWLFWLGSHVFKFFDRRRLSRQSESYPHTLPMCFATAPLPHPRPQAARRSRCSRGCARCPTRRAQRPGPRGPVRARRLGAP